MKNHSYLFVFAAALSGCDSYAPKSFFSPDKSAVVSVAPPQEESGEVNSTIIIYEFKDNIVRRDSFGVYNGEVTYHSVHDITLHDDKSEMVDYDHPLNILKIPNDVKPGYQVTKTEKVVSVNQDEITEGIKVRCITTENKNYVAFYTKYCERYGYAGTKSGGLPKDKIWALDYPSKEPGNSLKEIAAARILQAMPNSIDGMQDATYNSVYNSYIVVFNAVNSKLYKGTNYDPLKAAFLTGCLMNRNSSLSLEAATANENISDLNKRMDFERLAGSCKLTLEKNY